MLCAGTSIIIDSLEITGDTTFTTLYSSVYGCDSMHITSVTTQANPDIQLLNLVGSCEGAPTGSLALTATSSANVQFNWTHGEVGPTLDSLAVGTYSVEASDAFGCSTRDTFSIEPNPPAEISLLMQVPICFGESSGSIQLLPADSISTSTMDSSTNSTHTYGELAAGSYSISLIDIHGCALDTIVQLDNGHPMPVAWHESPIRVQLGDDVRLNPLYDPSHDIYWSSADISMLSCSTCPHPYARPIDSTRVNFTVTDALGCDSTASLLLLVEEGPSLGTPSAFSPNGDGNNDRWVPYNPGNAAQILDLKIFNRWGNLVFQQGLLDFDDPTLGWNGYFNGKLVNPDVYVYLVVYELLNGEQRVLTGDLTVIR